MNAAARQLMRALRGSRSQVGFSQELGYRSNVAAEWEGGRRAPHAVELLRVCEAVGIDAQAALRDFAPAAAEHVRADTIGPWLDALRTGRPRAEIARRSRRSRHQVQRWMTGTAIPRVPDFLHLVDVLTARPAMLVSRLVDLREVPSLHRRLPGERQMLRAIANRAERPVREGLRAAGIQAESLVVVPIAQHGLDAARRMQAAHTEALRELADEAGDPDTLAVVVLGSAPLT